MARTLTFRMKRKNYTAVPLRIDRRKLYGWTEIEALDEEGNPCKLVTTDETGGFIIPRGGTGLGILTTDGLWVDRSRLQPVSTQDNRPAEVFPSSYNTTVELKNKVTPEQFLDYNITAFYALREVSEDLIEKIGDDIFLFSYCYVEGCEGFPAFVMAAGEPHRRSLYMLIGAENLFEPVGLEQPGWFDDTDTREDDQEDTDLDFAMF